ncbi:MAG: IclR family transcriptional regulator [Rhodomicrobiaceae bacterium]
MTRQHMVMDDDFADSGKDTAVQKAMKLMRVLLSSETPRQLVDLSAHLDLPKPSVHRLLGQLEDIGFVQRDLSGRAYTVGPELLALAVDALATMARRPPVRDIMRELVERVRESCNLAILHGNDVLYLERVECDWPLRMQLQAGSRVPIHCTASGKLLLAHLAPAKRRKFLQSLRLDKYTANTITSVDALEAELEEIAETGVSINREEYHLGLIGVAVPVKRSGGQTAAALAVHAPIFRLSAEAARETVPYLRRAAERIAEAAGLLKDEGQTP